MEVVGGLEEGAVQLRGHVIGVVQTGKLRPGSAGLEP